MNKLRLAFLLFTGSFSLLLYATSARNVVIACYGAPDPVHWSPWDVCHAMKQHLKQCQPKVNVLEPPLFASPKQLRTFLRSRKLGKHVPVFVVGHGDMKRSKTEGVHYISNSKKGGYKTKDLLTVANQELEQPSIFVSACGSGRLCPNENCGTSCAKTELTSISAGSNIDPATMTVLKAWCKREDFDKADLNRNGIIEDTKEWNAYLCRENPRYSIFVVPKQNKSPKGKLVTQSYEEGFRSLLKELKSNSDPKLFKQMKYERQKDLENEVKSYYYIKGIYPTNHNACVTTHSAYRVSTAHPSFNRFPLYWEQQTNSPLFLLNQEQRRLLDHKASLPKNDPRAWEAWQSKITALKEQIANHTKGRNPSLRRHK